MRSTVILKHQPSSHWSPLLFALLILFSSTSFGVEKPLVIGVTPFISTVALFKRFTPLSSYLTEQLGREVIIETVTTPHQFSHEIGHHHYDLIFATPVMTLKAIDSGHYRMGVVAARKIVPLLMVSGESVVTQPQQLANKKVALPPNMSPISITAESWFLSKGLKQEELPQFVQYNSHNAAYQAALNGDVDAAFVASFAVKQLRKKLPILRIIDSGEHLPGSSILYSNSLAAALQNELTRLLVRLNHSQQGRRVLNRMSHPPFRRSDGAEYEMIRPYLPADLPDL